MGIVQLTSTSANVLVTEKENESGSTNQPIYSSSTQLPVISYNQPKFCPNVSWNSTATLFGSVNGTGKPVQDIFIDKNNTLYVALYFPLQLWKYINGSTSPISGILDSLASPTSLFVASNNDLYVAYGLNSGYYINMWTSVTLTNRALLINTNDSCGSLFIDINYDIYCSITKLHQVMKYSLNNGASMSTITVGHGLSGNAADMFSSPMGIFVDTNFYLYVADYGNNRIQRFIPGQMNGTSVAGSGSADSFVLNGPTSVILDGNKYLFITDGNTNGRIVRQGPNGFQCVIGCSSTDYLVDPFSMRFDNQGDLVVCDNSNTRIQLFTLTTQLCEIDQPTTSSIADAGSTRKEQLTSATKAESTMGTTTASLQSTSRFTSEKYAATTDATTSVKTRTRTHISTVSRSLTTPDSLSTKISETVSMMKIATTIAPNDFSEETNNALTTYDGAMSTTTTAESFVDSTNILIDPVLYSTIENEKSSLIPMLTTTTTIENEDSSLIQMLTTTIENEKSSLIQMLTTTTTTENEESSLIQMRTTMTTTENEESSLIQMLTTPTTTENEESSLNQMHTTTTTTENEESSLIQMLTTTTTTENEESSLIQMLTTTTTTTENEESSVIQMLTTTTTTENEESSLIQMHTTTTTTENEESSLIQMLTTTTTTENEESSLIQMLTTTTTTTTTTENEESSVIQMLTTTTTTTENEESSLIQMLTTTTTTENEESSLIPMLTTTTTMALITAVRSPSTSFVPNSCPNSGMMGSFCDISSALCDIQKPCQNMGTCINSITIPQGYICACPSGFNGAICELDLRPCKSTTCWNNGSCSMPMANNSQCSCLWGWEGNYCEKKVDYCQNITCLNHGICRSLFRGYKCECLPGLYSGSHCEYTAEYIAIRQYTSKSLAYIAITVMSSFVLFIVTLDILKYVFDIDVTRQERERIQRKRILQKRKAVVSKEPRIALRFIYVNKPPLTEQTVPSISS